MRWLSLGEKRLYADGAAISERGEAVDFRHGQGRWPRQASLTRSGAVYRRQAFTVKPFPNGRLDPRG